MKYVPEHVDDVIMWCMNLQFCRRNFLFWSDVSSFEIVKANLDGSEPHILVDNGLSVAGTLIILWAGYPT